MKDPILVVMAAGIGSRYGGLKQTDPVGAHGELIIDYSVYDAIQAGFGKVIFIINRKIESDFKSIIGDRLSEHIEVAYAYQELTDVPEGVNMPAERVKPLGTAHAVYSARHLIDAPFAVINADDYYGTDAFIQIYDWLSQSSLGESDHAMVGYQLMNTVTDNGYVSRGVCSTDSASYLCDVTERTHIEKRNDGIEYLDDSDHWQPLSRDTIVSMNMWGLTPSFVREIEENIEDYLNEGLKTNPLKCEYFLPYVVDQMIKTDKSTVKVLATGEKWYGVTYAEDKAAVVKALAEMTSNGRYPEKLWSKADSDTVSSIASSKEAE